MSHTAPGWSKCPHQAEGLPVDVAVVCFGVVVKKEVGLVGQPGCLGGRGNVTSGLQTQGKECWAGQPTCSPCLVGWGWREWKTSLMPSGAITTPWMLSFSFLFRVRRAKQFKLVYEMKMFLYFPPSVSFHSKAVCYILLQEGTNQPLPCHVPLELGFSWTCPELLSNLFWFSAHSGRQNFSKAKHCIACQPGWGAADRKTAIVPPKSVTNHRAICLLEDILYVLHGLRAAEELLKAQPALLLLGTIPFIPSPLTPAEMSLLIPFFVCGFNLRDRRISLVFPMTALALLSLVPPRYQFLYWASYFPVCNSTGRCEATKCMKFADLGFLGQSLWREKNWAADLGDNSLTIYDAQKQKKSFSILVFNQIKNNSRLPSHHLSWKLWNHYKSKTGE